MEEKLSSEWDWITEGPCTIKLPSTANHKDLEKIAKLEHELYHLTEQIKLEKAKYEMLVKVKENIMDSINKVKQ